MGYGADVQSTRKGEFSLKKVISKDGASIAFDQLGKGAVVILVCGGTVDRTSNAPLATLLAEHFSR
jgi:hypothetical protein